MGQGFLYTKVAGRELGVWFFILIFPLIFIGAGLSLVTSFIKERNRALESVSWTQTPGTIERVLVWTGKRSDVTVVYRYSVHGITYRSQRVTFGSVRKSAIMARAKKYHPGDAVTVFADPQDPTVAVIETGTQPGNWLMPTFGGALIIIGGLIGSYVLWNSRPSSDWSRQRARASM